MRHFPGKLFAGSLLVCVLGVPTFAQKDNPFLGRWDFDVKASNGIGANWLGVKEAGSGLEVWFQPTGGHVHRVKDVHMNGTHLTFTAAPASEGRPAMQWELNAESDKLTGVQKQGSDVTPLTGVRAPELKREAPAGWTEPEALFNGTSLDRWEPIGNPKSNWVVKNGILTNEARGANIKSVRKFDDFKVHFEVNCPERANSGFYLRGRYEMQLEYEAGNSEPKERAMGSIYGRIAPSSELPRTPGKWESFDITLVGRTVTIVRNGVTIIDAKEIEGITGGALDADEGSPGPFYIQGDHTGGLQFRNITVSVPKT